MKGMFPLSTSILMDWKTKWKENLDRDILMELVQL